MVKVQSNKGLAKRIVPCLDVKNGETVKGTNFVNLRSAGDPVELGKAYSDAGADELVFLDITASFEERKTFTDMVTRVAAEINIPFTVGGGINELKDVDRLLNAGADKVSINSAAIRHPARSQEPAKPYKELISSPVYFSNDQWKECLSSHGIIIDEKAKTLTIQSESTKSDMVYDLTDDELKALTNNSVKQVSVAKRLDILNNVIKDDFADKITMDMLNSKERIHIGLRPEVQQELDGKMQLQSTVEPLQVQQEPMNNKVGIVDGQDLDESKGWFREGKHGREVTVGEIRVEPAEQEGKFRMTAIINGEQVSHEITQKQYDKFMAVDDYHRMKLFSKIFGEVDMKDRTSLGTKIGAALLAGLGVAAEVGSELHRPHGAPVVIVDHHHGAVPAPPRPYFKPGVDTPMDVAARNFEAAMNQEVLHPHMGKGL